jgi:hypothetical protein
MGLRNNISRKQAPPISPKRTYESIIYLSLDNHVEPASETPSNSIQITRSSFPICPLWFTTSNICRIQRELTKDHAHAGPTKRVMHQSVLTVELLRNIHGYSVVYAKTVDQAWRLLLAKDPNSREKTLVLMFFQNSVHPYDLTYAYDMLTHSCGAIYPSRSEVIWEEAKVHDLHTLDTIARNSHTYRPITCYPGPARANCPLVGHTTTVLKRGYSSCSNHVKVIHYNSKEDKGRKPPCQCVEFVGVMPDEDDGDVLEYSEYYQWVHQEFVPSFVAVGEFRVFIAIKDTEPYVVHAILTKFRKEGDSTTGFQASALTHNSYFPIQSSSFAELEGFALQTYRCLRETQRPGFASFDVGVRLDIGLAPNGTGFFINEVTRWYSADHFVGDTLSDADGDRVARAYADALAESYPTVRKPVGVDKKPISSNCSCVHTYEERDGGKCSKRGVDEVDVSTLLVSFERRMMTRSKRRKLDVATSCGDRRVF